MVDDVKDDFDSEEHETHATVLDKLLAWEKKLYDEVKVCWSLSWINLNQIFCFKASFCAGVTEFEVLELRC